MRAALAALAVIACDGASRIERPETGAVAPTDLVEVSALEVTGGHNVRIVGHYLQRALGRAARTCDPPPGTRAELAMTIDRRGHVAAVGLRSEAAREMACAREHIEKQRFPRGKRRVLVGARVLFRDPGLE